MFTEINSLLVHQQREDLTREIDSERLARKLRAGRRPRHERRWSVRLPSTRAGGGLRTGEI